MPSPRSLVGHVSLGVEMMWAGGTRVAPTKGIGTKILQCAILIVHVDYPAVRFSIATLLSGTPLMTVDFQPCTVFCDHMHRHKMHQPCTVLATCSQL